MNITQKIVEIFGHYRMAPGPDDQYETIGKVRLIEKVDAFVNKNTPVSFSMLGYPFKSINDRDKVIGKLPDLGEKLSLNNFSNFANDIQAVYGPGAQFSFTTDGYIFSDLMDIDDDIVARYEERNRDLSRNMPILWYNMMDFYAPWMDKAAVRERITEQFGISSEELEHRILFDVNVNYLYRGMIKFMNQDLAIREYPSKAQLQKKAKIMAREMMFRNEAYSALIRSNFADHIRLSMHQSNNDGTKYSFQLIPGKGNIHSPWHSAVLVQKDGSFATIHKGDALAAGHELVSESGVPYYFQEV